MLSMLFSLHLHSNYLTKKWIIKFLFVCYIIFSFVFLLTSNASSPPVVKHNLINKHNRHKQHPLRKKQQPLVNAYQENKNAGYIEGRKGKSNNSESESKKIVEKDTNESAFILNLNNTSEQNNVYEKKDMYVDIKSKPLNSNNNKLGTSNVNSSQYFHKIVFPIVDKKDSSLLYTVLCYTLAFPLMLWFTLFIHSYGTQATYIHYILPGALVFSAFMIWILTILSALTFIFQIGNIETNRLLIAAQVQSLTATLVIIGSDFLGTKCGRTQFSAIFVLGGFQLILIVWLPASKINLIYTSDIIALVVAALFLFVIIYQQCVRWSMQGKVLAIFSIAVVLVISLTSVFSIITFSYNKAMLIFIPMAEAYSQIGRIIACTSEVLFIQLFLHLRDKSVIIQSNSGYRKVDVMDLTETNQLAIKVDEKDTSSEEIEEDRDLTSANEIGAINSSDIENIERQLELREQKFSIKHQSQHSESDSEENSKLL